MDSPPPSLALVIGLTSSMAQSRNAKVAELVMDGSGNRCPARKRFRSRSKNNARALNGDASAEPWRLAIGLLLISLIASASSTSFWEMSSFTDFIAGKLDGVALSRDGHLTQAPQLDTLFDSGQPVIWSVVPGADGTLYAATGHRGRVFASPPTAHPR